MSIKVKDIAEKLGLSASTVSLVLNNRPSRISAKTKHKILSLAGKMNYDKDNLVDLEDRIQLKTIAIISDIENISLVYGINKYLKESGIEVFIVPKENNVDRLFDSIDNLLLKAINGIVIVNPKDVALLDDYFSIFTTPLIIVNSDMDIDNASIINYADNVDFEVILSKITNEIIDRVINNKRPKHIILN